MLASHLCLWVNLCTEYISMAKKPIKFLLILFLGLLLPFSADASLQYVTVNAQGDLRLTVFVTDVPGFLYGWMKAPPSHALNISTTAETKLNQQVSAGIAITGFTRGPGAEVNLVVGFQITAPDGSVLFREDKWAVYAKKISIDEGIIITEPLVDIKAEPTDPTGNYIISATVTDTISDKKAAGSVVLKIRPDNVHSPPKEDNLPGVAAKITEYASIAVGANVRSGASLGSDVLRTVPARYPVAIIDRKEDWFLTEDFWGKKGWIYAPLLSEAETVIIKVFKGNLRRGPGLGDDIITQLDHGTIMAVLQRNGEWLQVTDSAELTGWLHHTVIWP
jgi:SH3-like domain-containing protein